MSFLQALSLTPFATGKLHSWLKIHDTCGVNNLHGMPGVMAGILSVLVVILASEESYGASLYKGHGPLLLHDSGDI